MERNKGDLGVNCSVLIGGDVGIRGLRAAPGSAERSPLLLIYMSSIFYNIDDIYIYILCVIYIILFCFYEIFN